MATSILDSQMQQILNDLSLIENDNTVPKNVRLRIRTTKEILNCQETDSGLKIDKSLEQLGDIADDPNLPQYTRMQIWGLVSQLERK